MDLTKIPIEIGLEIKKLVVDSEFQKRFGEDEALDRLYAQIHNKDIEFNQLMLTLKRRTIINGIAFKPITITLLSYLYAIQSSIINDKSNITIEDMNIFFYLLQTGDYTHDLKQLFVNSTDYCQKVLHLDARKMIFIFNRLYTIQFKVLSLFPRTQIGDQPHFDVDWMFGIISKVKPYVSYTTSELLTEVSISQIYYWYAQFRKNNGDNSLYIRPNEQILDEIDTRTIDLVIFRLIQKGILKKDQYKEYFDLMKQTKENKDGK